MADKSKQQMAVAKNNSFVRFHILDELGQPGCNIPNMEDGRFVPAAQVESVDWCRRPGCIQRWLRMK